MNSTNELNTGFSEITQERLNYQGNDPWFAEVALTGKCNFRCTYCNRFSEELDVPAFEAWLGGLKTPLRHIQLTGGEPTVHPQFERLVALCRKHTEVLGLSTNGSWPIDKYLALPVDMFSISLDDYDLSVLRERGYREPAHLIVAIQALSRVRYVNVGLVIDERNVGRVEAIIDYILQLGADDVKLSISTKAMGLLPKFREDYEGYPILSYRVKRFNEGKPMRGYPAPRCGIAKNDVTIVGEKHYPCLVYFREKGAAIGSVRDPNMLQQRAAWAAEHDCTKDPICSKYCMDFKCDFNRALASKE